MTELRASIEPFACAPALRLESHEKLSALHMESINGRLDRIEAMIERLEKRLWLTVYGVAGVILAEAFQRIIQIAP